MSIGVSDRSNHFIREDACGLWRDATAALHNLGEDWTARCCADTDIRPADQSDLCGGVSDPVSEPVWM